MEWGNLKNWFSGDARSQELRETRDLWSNVEALWRASPLARTDLSDTVVSFIREAMSRADRVPATPILVALCEATEAILRTEDITPLEPDWSAIDNDMAVAVEVREMLARRRRWAADYPRMNGIVRERFLVAYDELFEALPEPCFGPWSENKDAFGVSLIELLENPAQVIERLAFLPYDDDALRFELFLRLRVRLVTNLVVASGFPPSTNPHGVNDRLVLPTGHMNKNAIELAHLYLGGTPFIDVLSLPVPFHIADEARFEHCHIVGGTGHGKTQLMQRMIHADLMAAKVDRRSVVVIDSQGDLINKLMRLDLFDPDAPDGLADRLVLIDPADVEFPAALNLFDAHLERLQTYRPVDRERVLNGVIELYEVFFGAMLGADLTQKQGVIFRYLARLMITIPGATIHTLMQLMEDGKPFMPQMEQLDGSARYFFQTEFFHPSFAATKKQILRRLWGVLSTQAFERMFAQTRNKLDLFEAMNDGKIIFISTAKDLLKEDGSALFGRFFVAMLAQAALERSTLDLDDRTPTFVYVDEAQEYFDDSIETILNQARKYRVGLTLAHQTLDQLSPRLRSAINSNTSMKCVGGVSAKDARALADELRTSADFIESMRRRGERTEFAVWLKQMTPHAIRLSVPLGFLERQPLLTEEAFSTITAANRARYCGTLADVVGFSFAEPAASEPIAPRTQPHSVAEAAPASTDLADSAAVGSKTWPRERLLSPEPARADLSPRHREPATARELGKGGSQHRYVQHLIKGLAEERGFRAVIEEAIAGGQIDVALHRDGLSIACEISVTSKPEYEAQNLAKCLRSDFTRVFAVAADAKRLRAIEAQARSRLSDDDMTRIDFLTPEMVAGALDELSAPAEETSLVRGYRVKVSRTSVEKAEAQDRRAMVAKVIAQSMRGLSKDP
jgi:hypothetical protein